MNARMPELKRAFEAAGFGNVRTVLSSGNVIFDAAAASESSLERKAEVAMQASIGRTFHTIVRSQAALRSLVETDPFAGHAVPAGAKRVVSFMRARSSDAPELPIESDGACIFGMADREIFTAYVPSPKGPVFMKLLETAFGRGITTRTWDTIRKCVDA